MSIYPDRFSCLYPKIPKSANSYLIASGLCFMVNFVHVYSEAVLDQPVLGIGCCFCIFLGVDDSTLIEVANLSIVVILVWKFVADPMTLFHFFVVGHKLQI